MQVIITHFSADFDCLEYVDCNPLQNIMIRLVWLYRVFYMKKGMELLNW